MLWALHRVDPRAAGVPCSEEPGRGSGPGDWFAFASAPALQGAVSVCSPPPSDEVQDPHSGQGFLGQRRGARPVLPVKMRPSPQRSCESRLPVSFRSGPWGSQTPRRSARWVFAGSLGTDARWAPGAWEQLSCADTVFPLPHAEFWNQ